MVNVSRIDQKTRIVMGRDMLMRSRVLISADDLKTPWPEVVGMAGLLAGIRIHDDRPDVQVEAHWFGESVPPGFNDKLVRVFLNHDDLSTVAQTPS
uniref:Uncharacterized protein n=1 Tax=Arundo donax TaxID=35708 RepID=A0A0A9G8I7_ARUDO